MRKRLDFYIHDALKDFAKWYVEDREWLVCGVSQSESHPQAVLEALHR